MALQLKCACGERLSAPESAAGKRGKCPKCGMKFVVPGPKVAATATGPSTPHGARTAAPPQDDFGLDLPDLDSRGGALDDLFDEAFDAPVGAASAIDRSNPYASPQTASTPPKKRRVASRQGLDRLAGGIKLVFWGTLGTVATIVGLFILGLLAILLVNDTLIAILPMLALGVIGFQLLNIVGRVICLLAPANVEGKSLIVAAVACDAGAIGLGFASAALEMGPFLGVVSNVLGLATLILFVLFVKSVVSFIGQASLAEDASTVVVTIVVCIVASLLTTLLPFAGLVALVTLIIGTYKYLNLLQHSAEQLRR